jgi:dihydroflavonol-4-reductase
MYALGFCGDVAATVLRRDMLLSTLAVRLMHIMSPMDHSKAERELGWHPEPIHDSIRKAVHFYRSRAAADRSDSRAR